MDNTLEDNQNFWKLLFQQTDLTHQLMGDAEEMKDVAKSFEFNLTVPYGKVSVTAKPAVPLGSNFMSDVFSASAIDEQGKKYSGFVKVLPSAQSRVAAAFVGGYYHREYACYKEWIPELKRIKASKGLTDLDVPLLVADAYYVNLALTPEGDGFDNNTVYILENCKNKGYTLNTKAVTPAGIDLKHARAVMKTFANYHALSIAHLRKLKTTEGIYDQLSPACQVFTKDPNYISPAMVYRTIVLPSYSKILRHFKENETADWLDGYLSRTEEVWSFESSLKSGPLTCVIHGDSWSNNILFRYAEEDSQQDNPLDALLIDWQISRIGHVFVDLGYFLFSSTSSDFRRKHLTDLLIEYFSILKSVLSKLDIDLEKEDYNQDRFLKDCKDHFMIGLFVALFIMPILLDASKAVGHTLKNQESSSDPVVAEDAKVLEDKMDEEGTKAGWEGLFELTTVAANPLLSKRVVELLVDIRKWLTE